MNFPQTASPMEKSDRQQKKYSQKRNKQLIFSSLCPNEGETHSSEAAPARDISSSWAWKPGSAPGLQLSLLDGLVWVDLGCAVGCDGTGQDPTVPISLPVALAAPQLLHATLPQPSLSFFPFSRRCWPDNTASEPLCPHHPSAHAMRCDTMSLTYVTLRCCLLTLPQLAGGRVASWGARSSRLWVSTTSPGPSQAPPWSLACPHGTLGVAAGVHYGRPDRGGVGMARHPLRDPVGVVRLYPALKRCRVRERGHLDWKAVRSRSLSSGRLCFLTKSKNADSQQPLLMDSDCLSFALNNGRNYQRWWLMRCDWISSFSSKLNW